MNALPLTHAFKLYKPKLSIQLVRRHTAMYHSLKKRKWDTDCFIFQSLRQDLPGHDKSIRVLLELNSDTIYLHYETDAVASRVKR